MKRPLALLGASLNPPTPAHVAMAAELTTKYERVLVTPCGPRPDKRSSEDVDPHHRAAMCDIAFRGMPGVEIDLFDLENGSFTLTHDLDARYRALYGVAPDHVVGADLVKGGAQGASDIQAKWVHGPRIWNELSYAVFGRAGHPVSKADLPPRSYPEFLSIPEQYSPMSSTDVRERARRRLSLDGLVPPGVEAYIDRYDLYRGRIPPRIARASFPDPKAFVIHDGRNELACRMAERFDARRASRPVDADLIVVISGDGMILDAINEHWRLRLPFFGINAGHTGYLLNHLGEGELAGCTSSLLVRSLAQLHVKADRVERYAFNDAWIERASDETGWMEVSLNGDSRRTLLKGDGLLMATPAGSTAYASSMGAQPLHIDSQEFLIVGNNLVRSRWKASTLSAGDEIHCRVIDPDKRPMRLCVDGPGIANVNELRVRRSRVADVELAFVPGHDINEKNRKDLFLYL